MCLKPSEPPPPLPPHTPSSSPVAQTVGESRPPVIAKHSTTTEVSPGEVGPSWPRARSTPSAVETAVAKSADEARPPGVAKKSATTKPELAESSGGAGCSWSTENGNIAAATAAVKSAGEARPSWIVKCSVTSESESELAESSDEEPSPDETKKLSFAAREARIGSSRG